MTRLAVLTSGGDAPGMNAAVWAVTLAAGRRGWDVLGVRDGYVGLLAGEAAPIDEAEALRFARYGGTWLGTGRLPDLPDRVPELVASARGIGADAVVVIGGGGSLEGAALLAGAGLPVAGIPATIDNDVAGSDYALGHDTALNTGVALVDRIRDTAEALPRLFALETLGGDTGFIAQSLALMTGADVLLVPERPVDPDRVMEQTRAGIAARRYALIIASEGVPGLEALLDALSDRLGTRLRFSRLGHAQRGGIPTARDRVMARAFATAAVDAVADGQSGWTVLRDGRVAMRPLPPPTAVRPLPDPEPMAL